MTEAACLRTDHMTGYIELAFLESSHAAVDQLLAHLIDIIQQPPAQPVLRIFINSRHAKQAQPIIYLMRRLRQEQAQLRTQRPLRVAVTFNLMPLAQTIGFFVRSLKLPNLKFKAFGVQQEQEALAWLLET